MNTRLFTFVGGATGTWRVINITTIAGTALADVPSVDVQSGHISTPPDESAWVLHGITSNDRYINQEEKGCLLARQPRLGRTEAICAALIPVRKTSAW